MKSITILGSTGSIGKQAVEVIVKNPQHFCVIGLCCDSNIDILLEQINLLSPQYVAVKNIKKAQELSKLTTCKVLVGEEGINQLASYKVDLLINALVGISGLQPTLECLKSGNNLALANKETLVAGGDIVMPLAKEKNIDILPIDSEHNAIWQCLNFNKNKSCSKILLTASGGAFRDYTKEQISKMKAKDALKHPTWNMGLKVTIDSATMMNKGLEIIEAMRLFDKPAKDIVPIIHKQSVVHSMVQFCDGSIIAQMSQPDMRLPISVAMFYPERMNFCFKPLDFSSLTLDFKKPNYDKFPCLKIAMQCAEYGGNYPIIMNACNEILVSFFEKDLINFYDIPYYMNMTLAKFGQTDKIKSVEEVVYWDKLARDFTTNMLRGI